MSYQYKNKLHGVAILIEETGELFETRAKCARDIGGTSSGIHDCKTGHQKQHRGYHFEFFEEDV